MRQKEKDESEAKNKKSEEPAETSVQDEYDLFSQPKVP